MGATGYYLDNADVEHTSTGPSVRVANGENIETTKRALVPLAKELSITAKVGHIFDGLQSGSLISIGHLCDGNCVACSQNMMSRSTKMDRSLSSENATTPTASEIFPWH